METIIGLLFILLPVILKLIGRKFEQSGQTEKAGKIRELAKAFEEDGEDDSDVVDDDGDDAPVRNQPQTYFHPQPPMVKEEPRTFMINEDARRTTVKPVVQQQKHERKGEKIDPKKLVIYSEIMKPKYK